MYVSFTSPFAARFVSLYCWIVGRVSYDWASPTILAYPGSPQKVNLVAYFRLFVVSVGK